MIDTWAQSKGLNVTIDPRLVETARAFLPTLTDMPEPKLDIDPVRRHAQQLGWTDGQLAVITLRVPGKSSRLMRVLRSEIKSKLATMHLNRAGIAIRRDNQDHLAIVLLSEQLVQLAPVSSEVVRNTTFTLRGQVLPSKKPTNALHLVLGYPNNEVSKVELPLELGEFHYQIYTGKVAGTLHIQLLIERGDGPEIALSVPVGIESDAWQTPMFTPLPSQFSDAKRDSKALASLILKVRQTHGVSLPSYSMQVAEIAQAHANDMRDGRFFAHRSPTTGEVTDRLQRSKVEYSRVLENIAVGDTLEHVVDQWMQSPSHRQNLLDPNIDAFGVGVAQRQGQLVTTVVLLSQPRYEISR